MKMEIINGLNSFNSYFNVQMVQYQLLKKVPFACSRKLSWTNKLIILLSWINKLHRFTFTNLNVENIFFSCVPGVFGNQQPNYLDLIKQMLQLSVNDASNYEVSFNKKILKMLFFYLEIIRKCDSRHHNLLLISINQLLFDDCNL